MMWLYVAALVAVILSQCRCTNIDCHNMFPETPYGEFECLQEQSEDKEVRSCEEINARSGTWRIMNSTTGTVTFEFDLLPASCGHSVYRLNLYMDESVTDKDQCDKVTYSESLHSRRIVRTLISSTYEDASLPICETTATVTFNYIYTGCYSLELAVMKGGISDFDNCTLPTFLETSYKKELLVNKTLTITRQYRSALQQIDVGIQFGSFGDIQDLHMGFRLISDINVSENKPCYVSGHDHSCCAYWTSKQFMCKIKNKVEDKPSCEIINDEIKWTVQNVTPGYYCVLVEIFDDRCEHCTVWNDKKFCTYNSRIIEVPILPSSPLTATLSPGTSTPLYAILGAIFVILVMVCLFILVYVWRRRRSSSEPGSNCTSEKQPFPVQPRIFLLYSRDCVPFMNLMNTFREMLKEVTKCEVYDSFDSDLVEEVSRNKVDWITRHLKGPEVKVVVVESKCAVLHQKALIHHKKIVYKEPTWEDDIFLYGLRVLRDDLEQNTYGKVFVVRINGFTEKEDHLSHLSPYTRYIIPQHMEKLLTNLYPMKRHHYESRITTCTTRHLTQDRLEYSLIIDENADSTKRKLNEDVKNLENFKQENQDYLRKLLEKECI